jgi:hypothetical protein
MPAPTPAVGQNASYEDILDMVTENNDVDNVAPDGASPAQIARPHSPRPFRIRGMPARFKDYYVSHTFAGIATSMRILEDPENYAVAISSLEATEWHAAM